MTLYRNESSTNSQSLEKNVDFRVFNLERFFTCKYPIGAYIHSWLCLSISLLIYFKNYCRLSIALFSSITKIFGFWTMLLEERKIIKRRFPRETPPVPVIRGKPNTSGLDYWESCNLCNLVYVYPGLYLHYWWTQEALSVRIKSWKYARTRLEAVVMLTRGTIFICPCDEIPWTVIR